MSLDEYAERCRWEAGGAYLLNQMKDLEVALSKRVAQLEDGLPTTDDRNAADGAGAREMRDLLEDVPTARSDDGHDVHDAREEPAGGDSARSRAEGDNDVSLSPYETVDPRHGRAHMRFAPAGDPDPSYPASEGPSQEAKTKDVRGLERRAAAALSSPRDEAVDAEATRAGQGVEKEGLDAEERVSRGSGGIQDKSSALHPFGVAQGAGRANNVTDDEHTAAASFIQVPSACEVDAGLVGDVEGESRENVEEEARSIGNGRRHVGLAAEELRDVERHGQEVGVLAQNDREIGMDSAAGVDGSIVGATSSSSSPFASSSSTAAHCNDPITELLSSVKTTAPYGSLEGSNDATGASDAAGTADDTTGVTSEADGTTDNAVEVTSNVTGFTNDTAGAAIFEVAGAPGTTRNRRGSSALVGDLVGVGVEFGRTVWLLEARWDAQREGDEEGKLSVEGEPRMDGEWDAKGDSEG
ncbi:hypothetical protein EV122DRAFT_256152 [Schizophyllum commune]